MNKEGNAPLILIVEDNKMHIRLMCDLLHAYGMRVIVCNNPWNTISFIQKNKPDLILMDISLQEINGLELTQIIKKTPSIASIPVVALTAHATKREQENARSAGCTGFITKPINTRVFPRKIAGLINNHTP